MDEAPHGAGMIYHFYTIFFYTNFLIPYLEFSIKHGSYLIFPKFMVKNQTIQSIFADFAFWYEKTTN